MKKHKVVLAYSGGLDTSYCVKYLSEEKDLDVHAVTVDTGGFSSQEKVQLEERAYQLGAQSFKLLEATEDYYQNCLRYLIYGNVLRYNTYPLSVSAERIFQATAIVKYAQQLDATYIAHGSTGAGNDQVRFDLAFHILGDQIQILSPIRDQQLSREAEVAYLKKHGFGWDQQKARYSVNAGLWGTTVGGAETLTSHQPLPQSAYPSPLLRQEPQTVELQFEQGELCAIDGIKGHPVQLIQQLNEQASAYAIGRDIHVGDTVIGIKGRVGFEAAAPLIILKAHHLLEKHVLTKWQLYWKEQLANWYGMLLHEGQFLDPVMRNIEQFLESTQAQVSGKVVVALHPYRFELQGIESPHDLMSAQFGSYGEMNKAWSGEDVKGFSKILANQSKIHHLVNAQNVEV